MQKNKCTSPKHGSLDTNNTVLAVTEITALLVTVYEAIAFYETHFSSLQTYIKREKGQLQFETPKGIIVSI